MNLFVLSELHPGNNHVGWSVSYSLEETIAATCDATFIYPLINDKIKLSKGLEIADSAFLRRYRHRLFKSWFSIDELPKLGKGKNVLLVVGLQPHFLLSMHALGEQLNQFDVKIGYILDGFDPRHLDRSVTGHLDHLFVISSEIADEVNRTGAVPTSFLPLATNALKNGSRNSNRWIDIIAYGRGNVDLHRTLQTHFNQQEGSPQENGRVYFHSTFSKAEVENQSEHITLLSKMLSRSKISLCFEASSTPRFMGYSPILYRWFEAWAAGCTVVGKKPFGKGTAELMDWQNSAIDIPDSPAEWIPFFEDLLNDSESLALNAQRNYRECLLRHDWRYRLQDMFNMLDLPLPDKLGEEIIQLRKKAYESSVPLVHA
ncbi:glycosyltransferase family 1 protein [Phormidium tenue FACHB-886]|nr:glycosyltransferase family 1 protein [Phormidium tenue FACHB-886]